jgi:5,10-methylenetetrahydrofolate reductase
LSRLSPYITLRDSRNGWNWFEKGLHKEVKIIAGITPVTSLAAARYMKTKVPNMDIPEMQLLNALRRS